MAHLLSSSPVKSHGTMPVRLGDIHEFGKFMLEEVVNQLQFQFASNNYPVGSRAGEILLELLEDLTLIFLMYSPKHAMRNTR